MRITTSQRKHALTTVVATGLLVAALAACTTSVPGSPMAAESSSAAPPGAPPSAQIGPGLTLVPGAEALAATNTEARATDPCALHSVPAAEQVTGMKGLSLMPSDLYLASCELQVGPPDDVLSTWRLTASTGVPIEEKTIQQSTSEQIGENQVLHAPDLDSDGHSCRYLMDTSKTASIKTTTSQAGDQATNEDSGTSGNATAPSRTGLELLVQQDVPDPQTKTACQVAKDYLAEVIKYWTHPALRTDKLTTPALPLANVDPCAALVGVAPAMGGHLLVNPSPLNPFECDATPSNGQKLSLVSDVLKVATDPRRSLENNQTSLGGKIKPVTVAGHTGTITATAGDPSNPKLSGFCTVDLVLDDKLTISDNAESANAPKSMQVVETRGDTCELAQTVAESVLSAVH